MKTNIAQLTKKETKTAVNPANKTAQINLLRNALERGAQAFAEVGSIIVQMVDEDPNAADFICEQIPQLSYGSIRLFEKIGRKLITPLLAFDSRPGPKRLLKCPLDTQEHMLSEPIEVLLADGETLKTDVRNLTVSQANQVFDNGEIRTLPEQRAWMETQKTLKSYDRPKPVYNGYEVDKKRQGVIIAGIFFSLQQLTKIQTEILA